MPLPDPVTIFRDLPLGEGCLSEVARRVASACLAEFGSTAVELWMWRTRADFAAALSRRGVGEPRQLVRQARVGAEDVPTESLEEVARELEGAIDERVVVAPLTARAAAGRESRCMIGVLGVLVVLQDHELPTTQFDECRAWLSSLAESIAQLLPSEELAEINRWLIERGRLDRQAARAFAKVQSITELARTIDAMCDQVVGATYSGLYFIDPETGALRLCHARGLTEAERMAAEQTALLRHPGRVIRSGRPIDIPDLEFLDEEARNMPVGHGREVRARLFLPVVSEGRTIGTIGFASPDAWSFNHRHRQILAFLADFAGLAYGRIEAESRSARRGRLLEATGTAAERLLGAVEWKPSAYAALALVGTALDAEMIALLSLTPLAGERGALSEQVEFVWQPSFGAPWPHMHLVLERSADELARLTRDESVSVPLGAAEVDEGRVMTLKPVLVAGQLWGVVACVPKRESVRGLDRVDRLALRSLAGYFATALARERLHAAAEEKQRMQAVGQLASGIASDFNDLLWPILLYTEVLGRDERLDDRARQMVAQMQQSARDASELVQQVLAIARRQDRSIELVKPADVAIELTHMLRRMAATQVRIDARIDPESGQMLGDRAALAQVLLTLGTNAVEAVRDQGGVVTVEVRIDERAGQRWMVIAIEDNGPGLTESVQARIFDPYFAESENMGDGNVRSGLGLSLVRQAVADMDGRIAVSSALGQGARFEMLFPKVSHESFASTPTAMMPASQDVQNSALEVQGKPTGGSQALRQRVLFVDDDPLVLEVGREMLGVIGFEVVACINPADALLEAERGTKFDLVLTDLTMPGMTGIELARELRRRGYTMPIVCCTGYVDAATERAGITAGMSSFLRKPIDLERLQVALEAVLQAGS
jgi:signal transduction histidine kinase